LFFLIETLSKTKPYPGMAPREKWIGSKRVNEIILYQYGDMFQYDDFRFV